MRLGECIGFPLSPILYTAYVRIQAAIVLETEIIMSACCHLTPNPRCSQLLFEPTA